MAARWGIALSGFDRLDRALKSMAADVSNFRAPLEQSVRKVMIPSIVQNFEVGGRPPWEPLSDETIARKGDDRPLIETGQGMRSAGARARWVIGRDRAEYHGESFPERSWPMQLHQHADDFNVNFPARPFAVVQPEDMSRMQGVFAAWLDRDVIPRYRRG